MMINQKETQTVWRLRRGMDRRFRSGHPWVYSNELMESPKGIEPGAPVELQDAGGKFLARGYGNPKSLIAFRTLSRDPSCTDPMSVETLSQRLARSYDLRVGLGLEKLSHRLCFGEADFLPGWVIDRYVIPTGQVFSVQAHTAGADRWNSNLLEILKKFVESRPLSISWENTSVVLRNDLAVRKLEGLSDEDPKVLKDHTQGKLASTEILVASAIGSSPISFHVNLVEGQKTGFFLDQAANIQLAIQRLLGGMPRKVRMLDLCCYVGQWSTQFAHALQQNGIEVEVVAVDASMQALELAQKNIQEQGARCEIRKADVLRDLESFSSQSFDLVIADPPALIKNRKDIPVGTHAYLQLLTQSIRLVKDGGGIVACSCSALLEEESFAQVLTKAAFRNQAKIQWVGRGAPAADHPMLTEFPEGRYLKGWIGRVIK
jgi:23S rRNA (cytosine1962-C5)-methyltransferase